MINLIAILLSMLILSTNSRCTEGCLRCNSDNKCLYCDVLQDYRLFNGRCILQKTNNCVLVNDKNQCLKCKEQYYLDPLTTQCIQLFDKILVENCAYHKAPKKCDVCKTGYVLQKNSCIKIANPISNCIIENNRAECEQCQKGYILSLDYKSCNAQPKINNCATYTHVQCKSCKNNYFYNENYYSDLLYGFDNSYQFRLLHRMRLDYQNGISDTHKFSTCQKKQVKNCLIFENFDNCKQCEEGYFVNTKKQCESIPSVSLPNCLRYSSATTCLDCAPGYYLKSETECLSVTPIQNCMLYKTNANFSSCLRCTDNYYLSAENLCTRRTDISNIDLCEKLSHEFEKCDICAEGYKPTSDGYRCLPRIQNCQNYGFTTTNSYSHTCKQCQQGYYYNIQDRVCIQGKIQFCLDYEYKKHECIKCQKNFYLNDQKCEPHNKIAFCTKYSNFNKNLCTQCEVNSILFEQKGSCEKVDRIQYCDKYKNKTSCEKCIDGYYTRTQTYCELIPPSRNCLQLDNDNFKCIKCLPKYMIKDGQCIKPEPYLINGCSKWQDDGTTQLDDFQCQACHTNYVPIEFKDTFACKRQSIMSQKQFQSTQLNLDQHCAQFKEKDDKYICLKCKKDFYLVDNICSPNCYKNDKLTIYRQWVSINNNDGDDTNESIIIQYSNICEKTIPNCAIAQLDISQDFINIRYVCEKCVTGYLPVAIQGNITTHINKEQQINLHMPLSSRQGVKCVKSEDYIILGEIKQSKSQNNMLQNCEMYEEISNGILGCKQCQFSFVGTINQLIRQCKVFNQDETCKECNPLHYLKNKMECVPVQIIEQCKIYNGEADKTECKQCQNDFYVKDNKCIQRIISLKKQNCQLKYDQDICECNQGYILNPQKQYCEKLPQDCIEATFENSKIKCTKCDDKKSYINNENICIKGIIQNCKKYDQQSTKCIECENGYYKDQQQANLCIQHSLNRDQKCTKWSQTQKDVCEECTQDTTLFNKINECKQITNIIENCEIYENEYSCQKCIDGYYLNNVSKTCYIIPDNMNCLKLNVVDFSNEGKTQDDYTIDYKFLYTCEQCKKGYFRKLEQVDINKKNDPNNTIKFGVFQCKDWLSYMRENCQETQIDGIKGMGKIQCEGCQKEYFPYNLKDKMICIDRQYIKERKNGFLQDQNCLAYEYSNNQMKCIECKYPKLLKDDSCVDTCANTEIKFAIYIDSNKRYKKNVCVKNTAVTNCEWHVPAESDTANSKVANSYTCYKCKDGFQKVFKNQNVGTGTGQKLKVTMFNPFQNDINIQSIGDTYSEFDCVDLSTKQVRGLLVDNKKEVENCDLYVEVLVDKSAYGCKKCKFGYRGRVLKTTNDVQAHIEYCEKFDDCDTTVIGGLHLWSNLESTYGPLNNYMSCLACKNDKILVSFQSPSANSLDLDQYQTTFIKGTDKYNANVTNAKESYDLQCVNSTDIFAAHDAADDQTKSKLIKKATANDAIETNCAFMIINVNAASSYSSTNQFCIACKPTYELVTENSVTLCKKIVVESGTCPDPQSNDKKLLNTCLDCVWTVDNQNDLVKNSGNTLVPDCLTTTTNLKNCFAGIDDSGTKKCKICKPGYEINSTDGKCYKIQLDNNHQRIFNFFDTFWNDVGIDSTKWRDFSQLALNYTYQGENTCKQQDVLYKVTSLDDNLGMNTCITEINDQNIYDKTLNIFLNGTDKANYEIVGCIRYGYINNKLVCRECDITTHILTQEDNKCLDASISPNNINLLNCIKAEKEGSAVCLECKQEYRNVGGLCLDIQSNVQDFNQKTYKDYFIENCKIYSDLTKLNYKGICNECNENYYIKNLVSPFNKCESIPQWAGQCKDFLDNTGCVKCKLGYGLIDIKGEGDNIKRACVKMSDTSNNIDNNFEHDPNCTEMVGVGDIDSMTKQKLKCLKCKQNYVLVNTIDQFKQRCYSVVTPINNCKLYDFANNEIEKIKKSTYKCKECNDIQLQFLDLVQDKCIDRNNKNNCEQFDKYSDRCLKCEEGFRLNEQGTICTDLKNNNRSGYLQACKQNEQCDNRFRYEGLNSQMNQLFTCHKCKEEDQIPFIIVNLKEDIKQKQLEYIEGLKHNVEGLTQWQFNNDKKSQQLLQCIKPDINSFNLKSNTTLQLPQQCALGLIDISKQDIQDNKFDSSQSNIQNNPDLTKTAIRCIACQPKYKPTLATITKNIDNKDIKFDLQLLITSCILIENCENSTWFNSCTQCKPGFGYNYNKQKGGILYDECINLNNNKYCYAMDSIKNKCIYCKKGTYMNKDGICEIINPEKCEFDQFRYRGNFEQRDLQQGIFYSNEIVGCNKCQDGYLPVLIEKSTKICTHSMYHVQKNLISQTMYIKNCISYGLDKLQQLTCKQCDKNYVLSSNHSKQCFDNTKLQNCKIAFNDNICLQCIDNFVLVNSQCVSPTIQNCKEYGNNEIKKECPLCTINIQKCIKCEEEYYLSGGKCIKGEIKYCEHLETSTQCIECKDGYTKINMKGGKSYCYPNDIRYNCKEFDKDDLQSGILNCKECINDKFIYSLSKTDTIQNTCMPFDFISNCIQYNNSDINLADSNFQCIQCNPQTYLDNNECKDRLNMPDECIEYFINSDQCKKCQEGYYISNDFKSCIAYPQGLYGCLIYQSKTVCAKCESNFILRDEKCIQVLEEIENCKYYEDLNTCLECSNGFVNIDNKCLKPFALNCATYLDTVNCKTCQQNFHLELNTDGNINCIASSISNCIQYNLFEPYGCTQCTEGFYVADGICVAITEKLEGCIDYKDANVCKKCSSDYALKYDGSSCIKTPEVVSQIDLNCNESLLNENPSCNTCQPGYYFVYGQCVSCPKKVLNEGCYTCDPRRPSRCLMCQSGYVQSPEGDCVKPVIESYGLQYDDQSLDDLLTR